MNIATEITGMLCSPTRKRHCGYDVHTVQGYSIRVKSILHESSRIAAIYLDEGLPTGVRFRPQACTRKNRIEMANLSHLLL